jgi:type II secretory pathway pseudopilin PulG
MADRPTRAGMSRTGPAGRRPQPPRPAACRPRGIAVLVVLGLLAVTLAISYATLRGQGTMAQLASNQTRALDAQEAARTGLAVALQKMSQPDWAGVTVPLTGMVLPTSGYQVTFTTGDERLTPADPQYPEYPYRVTIDALGYAFDPRQPAVRTEHRSRCVVQLLRRRLVAPPANWSTLTAFTVYQYSSQDAYAQFPMRIGGPTRILGRLRLCSEYPGDTSARNQYLSDLNARRLAGLPDARPFPQTISIALSRQDNATIDMLTNRLGSVLVDASAVSTATPLAHPGSVLRYRLYPGGKEYDVPVLQLQYGNPLQNVTLGPDVRTNPLGLFRSSGSLSLQDNVQITGMLITEGSLAEVQIYGTSVRLQAVTLPPLYGSNQTYQLPAALVLDDLRINSGAAAELRGAAVVWDEFEVKAGATSTRFDFSGNLVTRVLLVRGRTPWVQTAAQWKADRDAFVSQLGNLLDPNRSLYFPDYMERQKGFVVQPTLTFVPASGGVQPHWHDWSQPLFQPDPSDGGLRWEVVRWEHSVN